MWSISASLVFLIGLSRVYLGVHYPTDVLAGFSAALIWIRLGGSFVEAATGQRRREKNVSKLVEEGE